MSLSWVKFSFNGTVGRQTLDLLFAVYCSLNIVFKDTLDILLIYFLLIFFFANYGLYTYKNERHL